MINNSDKIFHKFIKYCDLPLAIYSEIVAHLEQIPHLNVDLVIEDPEDFDYYRSQIKGIYVSGKLEHDEFLLLQSILKYYEKYYEEFKQVQSDLCPKLDLQD